MPEWGWGGHPVVRKLLPVLILPGLMVTDYLERPSQGEVAMSLDGLSIRRTDEGHFVLVHIDKTQKLETEKHRSVDLDEVVDRLLDGHGKNNTQSRLSQDYGPVLESMKYLVQKHAEIDQEDFPVNWTDPLELYGCIREELIGFGVNLNQESMKVANLVFYKGPEWVWKNRLRLVAEKVFVRES
jgi:hypothetical protein